MNSLRDRITDLNERIGKIDEYSDSIGNIDLNVLIKRKQQMEKELTKVQLVPEVLKKKQDEYIAIVEH